MKNYLLKKIKTFVLFVSSWFNIYIQLINYHEIFNNPNESHTPLKNLRALRVFVVRFSFRS